MSRLSAKVDRFAGAVRSAHREGGRLAALRTTGGLVVAAIGYRCRLLSEWHFDRRWGIDTRGVVAVDSAADGRTAHRDGVRYQPTRPRDFDRLTRSLPLELPPAAYTFVDLGCGKGRVLVLAAARGFGRVVGVEVDGLLVEAARANVRSMAARRQGAVDVEVVAADAAHFELPPEPAVIYLYNPFGERTVSAVAKNLQRSLERSPRPMLVVYYNPVHQRVLEEVPALRRVPSGADFWSFFRAG